MTRQLILLGIAGVLTAMLTPPTYGGRHSISTLDEGLLAVDAKGPCVLKPITKECDWDMSKGNGTTQIALFKQGRHLAYKLETEGKGRGKVILGGNPGKGTQWEVKFVRESEATYHTIQATSGKVKGWYLTVEEKGEEFTDSTGKKVKSYRVYLSEKATKHSRWDLTEIGP